MPVINGEKLYYTMMSASQLIAYARKVIADGRRIDCAPSRETAAIYQREVRAKTKRRRR